MEIISINYVCYIVSKDYSTVYWQLDRLSCSVPPEGLSSGTVDRVIEIKFVLLRSCPLEVKGLRAAPRWCFQSLREGEQAHTGARLLSEESSTLLLLAEKRRTISRLWGDQEEAGCWNRLAVLTLAKGRLLWRRKVQGRVSCKECVWKGNVCQRLSVGLHLVQVEPGLMDEDHWGVVFW